MEMESGLSHMHSARSSEHNLEQGKLQLDPRKMGFNFFFFFFTISLQ